MSEPNQELPPEVHSRLVRLLDEPDSEFARGVEALCAAQPTIAAAIRVEAASLLRAGRAGTAHDTGAPPPAADRATPEPLPARIGAFRILAEVGRGGMGTVYLAERGDLKQRVALKVIKLGMDSKAVLARFDAERHALSRMEHSHIAKVLDGGTTDRGQPWFAMEYVKGEPINRYCDKHRLSIEERLRLFQQVCSGVQHAHTKGVVHRDLTPNNILVTVQEGKAAAKIIDFGLAKATDRGLTEKTLFTEQGLILGTPEYMAPEQAGIGALDIDTRADIYTLGVLLYELLVGALPFSRDELRVAGWDGMCKTIQEKDAPRPSTKITGQAATQAILVARRTDASALRRRLRGDLDWVVMKCLEKDRTRRYETATELAAEVQRHLDHEPVLAHAPSVGYRLRKFARRYRRQLASAAVVLVAVFGALVTAVIFWREAAAQATEAERQKGIAQGQTQAAESARAGEAAKAQEAAENAKEAQRNAAEAQRNAKLFETKVGEFEQLKGVVLYDRAIEVEKTLYPAWPHQIAAMERWLKDDAGKLLSMRGQIEETVRDLRERALPATPEQIAHDKTSHPKFGDWQKQAAKLASLERAHAIRTKAQVLTLPLPTAEEQAMTPSQLNTIAWPRVDSDESKRTWGEEAHALTLAKLAWEKTAGLPDAERYQFGDTLAWAWFANGKDDEARAQSEATLALAPAEKKAAYEGYLATLQAKVQAASGEGGTKALVELRALVSTLEADVSKRRTFAFADESQRFLHDTLSDLLAKLGSLDANERKAVDARLGWAQRIGALTQNYPNTHSWNDVRRAIATADGVVASELYRGQTIELRDQDVIGLVPIGMNPATKLWEFYELASAWDGVRDPATLAIPRYVSKGDDHGYLEVGADTGIVFVLLPGGTFTMGTQADDPNAPSYDPQRVDDEAMHEVTLAPFFLARHELTQGQWRRLSGGETPSYYGAGKTFAGQAIAWSNPVESVDWAMCVGLLGRQGMVLPTEAQWEYGCRAGTTTPWLYAFEYLVRYANLADATAKRVAPSWPCETWNDGHVLHAAVGSFLPNRFGLFDVHGNVLEWTRDGNHGAAAVPRLGDGLRGDPGSCRVYVNRGGSFDNPARYARSGYRTGDLPTTRLVRVGLRPARASQP